MFTGHKNLNPLLVAEPFQASQGDEVPTSPKDLQDFYEDMERREIERRQSRGKSRRWTRRGSIKSGQVNDKSNLERGEPSLNQRNPSDQESELDNEQAQATGRYTPLGDSLQDVTDDGHSSVAELRIGDLVPPPWSFESQEHVTSHNAPPSSYRTSYKIHNPVGPRFYRNHHLRPLNNPAISAALRPSSAFSSAFPPLSALPPASPPPRGLGLGHAHLHPHNHPPQFPSPDTSFSSSESALPTPDSSQSALHGQGGEALRKSNNVVNGTVVADPVDQLDGSNPYGQKFHHDSPYDLGKKGKGSDQASRNGARTAGSLSVTDLKPPRSRMSMQVPRKTTPSPLSQSTSALNIQSEGEEVFVPQRKLSKRRGGGLKSLFGPSSSPDHSPDDSRPPSPSLAGPSPIDHTLSVSSPVIPKESSPGVQQSHLPVPLTRKLSKSSRPTNRSTGSLVSTSPTRPPSPDKGGKRTSVFGRIAKRFSLARKPESSVMPTARRGMFDKGKGKGSAVSLTETDKGLLDGMKKSDMEPAPEGVRLNEPKKSTDFLKRVPPPSLEPQSSRPASSTHLSPTDVPSTSQASALPSSQSSYMPQLPDLITGTGLGIFQPPNRDSRRDSLTSLEPEGNWRLGKLTIANPDVPGSSETDLSVTVRGEGDSHSSPPGNGDSRLSTRGDGDARGSSRGDRDARISLREDADVRVSRASVQADRESVRVDADVRASLRSGAPALMGGNKGATPRDLKESPLPPVPRKEQKTWSEQSVFDETPRASIAESTHASIPRAPSPVLPPPPVHERLPSTPQKSLPQIETVQSKSEQPSRAEVYSPKSEPSSKPQPSLPAPLPAMDPPLEPSTSSYAKSSRHIRQQEEHEYYIDVPVEGHLFTRTTPNGISVPPIEKPTLPALPPKSKPRESTEKPSASGQSFRPSSKETTVFTSIFSPPSRPRHTSESSPNEGSSHGRGYVSAPAPLQRSRGHVRTGSYSPDKPVQIVYVRAGSESPDKEGRRERIKERDQERERKRDHRVAGTDSDRSKEDATPRRERERRESSVRRRDKGYSDRERDRRREEREREDRTRDIEERGRVRVEEHERDKNRGREREKEREREDRDREKARQREKEGEERERRKERERAEREKEKERERADRERERQREKDREREKAKDREREREKDRERDREREREKERERAREKEREREKEKEKEKERERVKEKAREREKEKEREKERERGREKARERGREKEKEKAREREKEKERAQEKEKEREWVRHKEQDSRVERETVKYHLVPRHRTSSMTTSSNNHPARVDSRLDSSTDEDDLRKVSARGEDWEIVEKTKSRRREGGSTVQVNGYSTNSATFPRRSSSTSVQKDIPQLTDRPRRESRSGERDSDPRAGVSFQTSYRRSRQRAYSMETSHSRPSSTAPLSPPEIDLATKSRWREDDRYFQSSSTVPVQHVADVSQHPDPRSTSAPYLAPRPTSGFPSPDWAQFRAKEAWERDRMWRGHSMTFTPEVKGGSSTASTSAPIHTGAWAGVSPHDQVPLNYGSGPAASFYHQPPPAHHGSSYTSFLVQPAWSYAQYAQPAPAPDPIPPFSLQPSSNPLPPPPRRSAFDTRMPPGSSINQSASPEAIQ